MQQRARRPGPQGPVGEVGGRTTPLLIKRPCGAPQPPDALASLSVSEEQKGTRILSSSGTINERRADQGAEGLRGEAEGQP